MVVPDLAALDHPELHGPRAAHELQRTLDALPRAAAIVAVSDATADALVARGVDRDRIAVTPTGLRQLPAPDERHVPAGPTRPGARRVGKECVSTCRTLWARDHSKKKRYTHTVIERYT